MFICRRCIRDENLDLKNPPPLYISIFANTYCKRRSPGLLFAYAASTTAIGRAITKNWIGQALGQIKQQWSGKSLNNDQIRIILKKTFQPQFKCNW